MFRRWVEIGDRVFVRRYAFFDQNIGVVLGGGEALVIDTRSTHVQAREILADLRDLTQAPVTFVVNTHGHFDHAFGNRVFRPATIWGQARCVGFIERTGEARRARIAAEEPEIAADLAEVVIDPPDRIFDDAATIESAGDRSSCATSAADTPTTTWSPCRTPASYSPAICSRPALSPTSATGSRSIGRPRLPALAVSSSGVVVPGHGDHAGREFAESQARAFAALADLARRVEAGDLTFEDAIEATPFEGFPPEDIRRPLGRALDQLRGELWTP